MKDLSTYKSVLDALIAADGNCWRSSISCTQCPVANFGLLRGFKGPYNCTAPKVKELALELQADLELDKLLKNDQT